MSQSTQTVWIRSEWAFVFQTHCNRHRTPLVESCAVCFAEDPLLPITSLPASTGWLALASCWKCGSSLLFCDPESSASSMVVEIIGLESAILTTVAGNSPNPRWAGRLCAKAFTEGNLSVADSNVKREKSARSVSMSPLPAASRGKVGGSGRRGCHLGREQQEH
jgi:hypothetical protein